MINKVYVSKITFKLFSVSYIVFLLGVLLLVSNNEILYCFSCLFFQTCSTLPRFEVYWESLDSYNDDNTGPWHIDLDAIDVGPPG